MALGALDVNRTRCVAIALALIALSAALQWLSTLAWAHPARTRAILEFLYLGRAPLLQAVHVMALALLTTGLLQTGKTGSSVVCASWAACACLVEAAQHPAAVDRLLQWTQTSPLPPRALDVMAGLILNARFSWSEVAGAVIGAAVARTLLGRGVMR